MLPVAFAGVAFTGGLFLLRGEVDGERELLAITSKAPGQLAATETLEALFAMRGTHLTEPRGLSRINLLTTKGGSSEWVGYCNRKGCHT